MAYPSWLYLGTPVLDPGSVPVLDPSLDPVSGPRLLDPVSGLRLWTLTLYPDSGSWLLDLTLDPGSSI